MKRYLLIISKCGLPEERREFDMFTEAESLVMAYASACGITLLRIKYTQLKQIDVILKQSIYG